MFQPPSKDVVADGDAVKRIFIGRRQRVPQFVSERDRNKLIDAEKKDPAVLNRRDHLIALSFERRSSSHLDHIDRGWTLDFRRCHPLAALFLQGLPKTLVNDDDDATGKTDRIEPEVHLAEFGQDRGNNRDW